MTELKCKYSELGEYNARGDEDFICLKHHFEEGPKRCLCDERCPDYVPDKELYIDDLVEEISRMFMDYPNEYVNKAYIRAYKKAQTHHVELDSCGKAVWVKND